MALNLPDTENIFPHSKEFGWGGGKIRAGQATIVVARDGSGDTSSIQEGVDLLPDTGGVVFIKEGTYPLSKKVTIDKNNVYIQGTGRGTKIEVHGDYPGFDTDGYDYITFDSIFIEGNTTLAHTSNDCILLDGSLFCKIIRCYLEKGYSGTWVAGGEDNLITNNFYSSNKLYGIYTEGDRTLIMGNDIYYTNNGSSTGEGIRVTNCVNCSVMGNISSTNDLYGINLNASCDDCVVSNNVTKSNTDGINIGNANCDDNIIIGNSCPDGVGDSGTNTEIINKQIDIDHDGITNTHNLTTDIVHDDITAGTIADHDTSATGTELDTLTDGSDSSALHVHTIVSLDTDTTGVELTSLADNSMVDTLHRHSELSASDGTPDAIFRIDATGGVILGDGAGAEYMLIDGGAGSARDLRFGSGGSNRWLFRCSGDAESGANVGSNFQIYARNDAGGSISVPFTIVRKDAVVNTLYLKAGNVGIGTTTPGAKLQVAGAIQSATATITASSDTTNVSGINTLFINITGDIVLGGLVGGVNGQVIHIMTIGNFVNHFRLEHAEGIGGATQDFINHTGVDEDISHGGCTYVCNGTNWYDASHAKHV